MEVEEKLEELQIASNRHDREIAELRAMDEKIIAEMLTLKKLTEGQNADLREIKEMAFRSTPPEVASRLQIQTLIWQILLVAITGTGILVGVVEWSARIHR